MADNYRFYEVNGKRYKISEAESSEFEKDFPSAKVNMSANGKKYLIGVGERDEFVKDFGENAAYASFDEEPKDNIQMPEENKEKADDGKVHWWESLVKPVGSAVVGTAQGFVDAFQALSPKLQEMAVSRIQPYGVESIHTADMLPSYDEQRQDPNNPLTRASDKLSGIAERLSEEGDPEPDKGFIDLIVEGKIGKALQKGLATTGESSITTLSARHPILAAVNMISLAGREFSRLSKEDPSVPIEKRAAMAIGSAAWEQTVEKMADPVFKYIGGGDVATEITEEMAKEALEKATKESTENIAKRIFNKIKGIGKNVAKDAGGEGLEEIISSAGSDVLGQTLDWVDGNSDYGFTAQWEELKKQNPDADLWDFSLAKAKEYGDAFIGGALSGGYMAGGTQAVVETAKAVDTAKAKAKVDESYNLGTQMDYVNLYDSDDLVREASIRVAESFVNEDGEQTISNEFIESLSYDEAFALSRNEEFSGRQRAELEALANAKAVQEGLSVKLDERLDNQIAEARNNVMKASENDSITIGMVNGRTVYVKGGIVNNGYVNIDEQGMNGPVIIVDAQTGEETWVDSYEINSAYTRDVLSHVEDIEKIFSENEAVNRETARNTMGPIAKLKAVNQIAGRKVQIDLGEGIIEVEIQNVSPKTGDVEIKGKKGDLGGQSIIMMPAHQFYDTIVRDDEGNPRFADNVQQGEQNGEPIARDDYRDFVGNILINGVPTEVEVMSQDDSSDSVVYEYIDENGVRRRGSSTIGEFGASIQSAEEYQPAPEPEPMPKPEPMPEPESIAPEPVETQEDVPADSESINWDELFERDPWNYLVELKKQLGDEALDFLNNEIAVAEDELAALDKNKGKSMNDRMDNLRKKAELKNRIGILNELVNSFNPAPVAEPIVDEPTIPDEPATVAESNPEPEPTPEPEPAPQPEPAPEPEPVEGNKPVAPNPVSDPIKEAQKRESELLYQLGRAGLSNATKQDLARRAGKAIADMFATREEYEAYEEIANDLGDYLSFFEGGVEESFANRQQNTGDNQGNSVPLSTEPTGEENGEQGNSNGDSGIRQGVRDNSGQTTDEGGESGNQGAAKVRKGKANKSKSGKQITDKYPERTRNATQQLLVDTFGFSSVTIPNKQKSVLNTIYDFMMGMAKVLGISPKSIGNGGWVEVANLNARAIPSAEHGLRYNRADKTVIKSILRYKYDKISGIAHEWWHALDHVLVYFDTGKGNVTASEISSSNFTGRQEVWEAVENVHLAIIDSGHEDRINNQFSVNPKHRDYLLEPSEMIARAFGEYIKTKFADAGISVEGAVFSESLSQPTPEEMVNIIPAFDNLFRILQEKEGKTPGTSVLYQIGEQMEPQSEAKKFATEGILTALDDGNRDVEILSDEQTEEYLKMIGADTETQFSIDTDKPIFISNAARAVAGIKQEKATPEQWLKMIEKAGGLKAGEDKWIGLSDWLKASDKKTLTRQEVLDFINENTIRIEEVNYRHWDDLDYIDEATRILEAEMREIGWDAMVEKYPNFDQLFEESNGELLWSENTAPISEYDKFIFDDHNILERPIHETREKYTSAGLENNREIAIVVPTIEPWKKYDELHFGDAGYGRAVAWVRFGEAKAYVKEYADFYAYQKEMQKKYFPERSISSLSDSDLESLTSEERAEFERLRDIAKSIPFAKRISRRVLVIDEIQSKRHQDGREWGYKSDFNSTDEEEQRILRELDAKNARMAELIREREEEGQQQRIRMAQIHSMLDFVKSNQEYDALLQEAEEIRTKVNNRSTEINNLRYELRRLESLLTYNRIERADRQKSAVPDAPFDKNWHELAMKRMLRYAAENGYDAVAWTKGEQQAERYSLAKSFSGIEREDRPDGEGGRRFTLYGGNVETIYVDENGVVTSSSISNELTGKQLSDVVGKDMAAKMMSLENNDIIDGENLRIGGEGMKGFYDKMLPAFMDKYGKKWGVKVSDIELPMVESGEGYSFHSVPVNDAMRESVMEGQPMFYKTPNGIVYGWTDGKKIYLTKAGLNPNTPIHEYTHLWAKAMMLRNPKGWENIKKLLKGTPVWNEVMNDVNYSNIHNDEDLVASEALSRISGTENAAKMEQMAQKMIDEAKGTGRKLEARGLIQNMRDALNKFWEFVWKDLFKMTNFRSVEHVTDRVLFDLLNNTDLGELSEGQVETQIVTDSKVIAELEASPKRTGYRNGVQNEDGTFSSPMAYWLQGTKTRGGAKSRVETAKFELGKWEEAEEHPELVDENGHVVLVKPDKNTVEVAYDPYIHNRLDPVNLQFKAAWKRPELVYVETEVPETDLNSGYHAEGALLPVGVHSWSNGDLMLSKYDKPVRIVPWEEVADAWVEKLNGEGVEFDVVPAALRPLLVERGVEILPPHNGSGKDCNDTYAEWKKENEILSRKSENNTKFVSQFEQKQINEQQELEYSDEFRGVQEESARMSEQEVSEYHRGQRRDGESIRQRLGGIFQRELERRNQRRNDIQLSVVNESKGTSFDIIQNVDGRMFHDIFSIVRNYLPNGELVDLHDNYDDAICYITSDGLAGFAVTLDGNLISVYSLYGGSKRGFLGAIKDLVTEAGATHLDGYNSINQPLAHIYSTAFGWKVASMMDYNMEYDHDNIAENHGMPQVAFMVNTDADIETRHFNEDQYDEAEAYQIEQVEINGKVEAQNAAVNFLAGDARNSAIEHAVNSEASKLGVNVTYKTRSEMPNGHQNDKGYYNTNTGEIVICTENAASIADAIQTILHEAVAHKGLRQLMGDKFNEFINRVYDSLDAETKAKVDALAESKYNGNTAIAMEEYMASLAETIDFANNSVWSKIKSIFEGIINAILGRNDIKIGDNELRYILRASYNNMVNPRNMETIRGWAQDQMMREDYNINHATPELLSRTGVDPTDVATMTAAEVYNRAVKDGWQEFQRQFQDAMQPVRIAIDSIQQETGNIPIEDYENYILLQNQSSSRSRVEIDDFQRRYYSPIIEHVNYMIDEIMKSRGWNLKDKKRRAEVYAEVRQYLIAKHGLERNKYYQRTKKRLLNAAERKEARAEAKSIYNDELTLIARNYKGEERKRREAQAKEEYQGRLEEIKTRTTADIRDYSGLTSLFGYEPQDFEFAEQDAENFVMRFEVLFGRTDEYDSFGNLVVNQGRDINVLWNRINAATDKTLRHSYESGLLSRQQYTDISNMFEFYIPLRGFDETTAEDVYSYARFEGNRFNPAVQTAEGRTSLADDPLAIIMNMAESEIAQGNKNRAKQALYNYLLNRPVTDSAGNQTQNSLMQIESVWYVQNVDAEGNVTYTMASPNREIGETYEEFENRMNALAEEDGAEEGTKKAYKSKKGKVDVGMRFQKPANANAHYIYLKVNGVEKAIYVNGDPKAADAINGVNKKPANELEQKMRTANRLISSTFTNYSLEFTARNYFRDMIYSHINIGVRESDPDYRKRFRQNWRHNNLRSMIKMLTAYRNGDFDGRALTPDEAAFVEFMDNGGQTGYTLINSVENHKKDLERAIKNMQKGLEKGGIKDSTAFKYTLGAIELLNEASELVTRFAAFKTSRDMGRSVVESISDAKEVTVNFNTKGAQDGTGWMGSLAKYLGWSKYFFNASVQGVQNIKAMAEANKLKFCTTVGGVMASGLLVPIITSVIANMLGGDEEEYWNIPEYDRQNNLCIVVGGGRYVKIPLPIGFREVYALGDMVAAMAFDQKFQRDAWQIGTDMANKIASIVLPINPLESSANGLDLWQTGLYTVLPSSLQFAIQNATNIDWKGAPLQKEYTYNENDPQWMKAFASNPDWMVGLSKWCNEHIGAGDMKGWDWSPEKLDNTLSNVFGGIYTVVKKTGKTMSMIWNEENRNLSNIPLTGVILGSNIDDDDRFVQDAYYDMKDYYDERIGWIKRRAEKFGYELDNIMIKMDGGYQPKIAEIYDNKNFEWMQAWYIGNKELEAKKKAIKDYEKELALYDEPSQEQIEHKTNLEDQFLEYRREFVDKMLEMN